MVIVCMRWTAVCRCISCWSVLGWFKAEFLHRQGLTWHHFVVPILWNLLTMCVIGLFYSCSYTVLLCITVLDLFTSRVGRHDSSMWCCAAHTVVGLSSSVCYIAVHPTELTDDIPDDRLTSVWFQRPTRRAWCRTRCLALPWQWAPTHQRLSRWRKHARIGAILLQTQKVPL